jgi:hypothetical protein
MEEKRQALQRALEELTTRAEVLVAEEGRRGRPDVGAESRGP